MSSSHSLHRVLAGLFSVSAALAQQSQVYVVQIPAIAKTTHIYSPDDPYESSLFAENRRVPVFPRFNPALGTLTDVNISATGSFTYTVYLDSEGIINTGVTHIAGAGGTEMTVQLVRNEGGFGFLEAFGISSSLDLGCVGNPGDGAACSDFNQATEDLSFSPYKNQTFIGTGNFENLFLEVAYPTWLDFHLSNVANASLYLEFSTTPVELVITYTYEPAPQLDVDVQFTGPKSGSLSVQGKVGKEYRLRRADTLSIAASDVIDTKPGLGDALVFSFDDSSKPDSSHAFFWIEEADAPGS